jgi:hypothetical protein
MHYVPDIVGPWQTVDSLQSAQSFPALRDFGFASIVSY